MVKYGVTEEFSLTPETPDKIRDYVQKLFDRHLLEEQNMLQGLLEKNLLKRKASDSICNSANKIKRIGMKCFVFNLKKITLSSK